MVSGISGSGKSTLFNAINGIIPKYFKAQVSGDILLNGAVINDVSITKKSASIGSVLQNADSQIIFSEVEDELAFVLENLNKDDESIHALVKSMCETLGLNMRQETATLSGGEKQKLIIGSTLLMNQGIIMLDEPLANLDQTAARELLAILRKLANQGLCIILIEHRLDMVEGYYDELLWLEKGILQELCDISHELKMSPLTSKENGKVIIRLSDVDKAYPHKSLYKKLNFTLREGEKWVIIGDNGTGKSTLLKILLGIEGIDKGERFSIYSKRKINRHIGYVMQNPSYQLFMPSVREELELCAKSQALVDQVIEGFELHDLLDRHPQSLSEGQKRRVGVAAILTSKPEILFMDEPSVGQDLGNMKKMLEVINQIYGEEDYTMVTITHDARCIGLMGKAFHLEQMALENISSESEPSSFDAATNK